MTTPTARGTVRERRKDYLYGYRQGRRNTPFTFLRNWNPGVTRGWGAGQEWLYLQIK